VKITEVLNRRADLSAFVVHLTKITYNATAKANLLSIIGSQTITAGKPMGWFQTPQNQPATVANESQQVVCFSETPLEHIYSLFAEIEDRQVNLAPYGLAFTKMTARKEGALPVWYADRTGGAPHQWKVAYALDRLREYAMNNQGEVVARDIAAALPHFEAMGSWPQTQKEFWWEREWRKVGDFQFDWSDVALWFAPENDHADTGAALLARMIATGAEDPPTAIVLDPSWGLERMIAKLVGLPDEAITPFKTR
jgi:hypothetical protein